MTQDNLSKYLSVLRDRSISNTLLLRQLPCQWWYPGRHRKQLLHVIVKRVIMRGRMSLGSCSGGFCLVADGDYVAIFHSIHRVMKAEKILKSKEAPMLLIPVPRQLTADCGLAIRYSAEDRMLIERLLREAATPPVEIFRKEGEDFIRC